MLTLSSNLSTINCAIFPLFRVRAHSFHATSQSWYVPIPTGWAPDPMFKGVDILQREGVGGEGRGEGRGRGRGGGGEGNGGKIVCVYTMYMQVYMYMCNIVHVRVFG